MIKQRGFILLTCFIFVVLAVITIIGGSLEVVLNGECKYRAENEPGPICRLFGYGEEDDV